jgi:hypothetical protein
MSVALELYVAAALGVFAATIAAALVALVVTAVVSVESVGTEEIMAAVVVVTPGHLKSRKSLSRR